MSEVKTTMMADPPTTGLPPLSSLQDWHVGATDNGLSEVRIVLADPTEAKAWVKWMFDRQEAERTRLNIKLTWS